MKKWNSQVVLGGGLEVAPLMSKVKYKGLCCCHSFLEELNVSGLAHQHCWADDHHHKHPLAQDEAGTQNCMDCCLSLCLFLCLFE